MMNFINQTAPEPKITSTLDVQHPGAQQYVQWVQANSKRLQPIQEIELSRAILHGSPVQVERAKKRLVESNLRLVMMVARRYSGRPGLELMELIQAGNEGLVKAVEKYDYRHGTRFSTYAMWWIQQAILATLSQHDRPMRLPGHVMDGVNKLARVETQLQAALNRQPNEDEVARAMACSRLKLQRLRQAAAKAVSIDEPLSLGKSTSQDSGTMTLGDLLDDPQEDTLDQLLAQEQRTRVLVWLAKEATERERHVLVHHFGLNGRAPRTLEDIGRDYQLTRESMRQTEIRALQKLRTVLSAP